MRVRTFLPVAAPLLLHDADGRVSILLAFAITGGIRGGQLVAMTVPPVGGAALFVPIEQVPWPSPIGHGPELASTGPVPLGRAARRAEARKTDA